MTDIRPVRAPRDLDAFLRLPWEIYRGDATWVPPLLSAERKVLDPARNPFWKHAEAEHFLARRDGRLVGRVSAIVNRMHNETHGEKTGWFGYFETENDPATAKALLGAAEQWLRAKGMERSRGPANPSMNDPCGLQVEGLEHPPYVLMTYNPPYYAALVEGCGYLKSMDLLAHRFHNDERVRARIDRIAGTLQDRGVTLRNADPSRFERELRIVMGIYNEAWSKNWGFTPMTEDDIRFAADDMKAILLPELVYFALHEGTEVGFALALPDINQALKRANGRLFPFGWWWFLKFNLRKIPTFRIVALGVKPSHQNLGIGPLFYQQYLNWGDGRYPCAEVGWVLESNELMNRPIKAMGAKPYKRYRIYEKPL